MRTYNILFLCTGNSARSIMAEALATTESGGRFVGYSAGSHPAGAVNPLALEMIHPLGYPSEKLRSKNWDEYAAPDAPQMDLRNSRTALSPRGADGHVVGIATASSRGLSRRAWGEIADGT